MAKKVIAIPDLHLPFHSKVGYSQILAHVKKEKPDVVVQLGDALDLFSLSRFSKSYNVKGLYRPIDEIEEGAKILKEFWVGIKKQKKGVKCIQLLGNHDARITRQIQAQLPELLNVVKWEHLYDIPGVEVHWDDRVPYVIDDVCYEHGYFTRAGQHARHNQMSTVHGHTHRASIQYYKLRKKTIFNFEVGYMADPSSAALSYTRSKWTNWHLGFGIIDIYGPRFVSLEHK